MSRLTPRGERAVVVGLAAVVLLGLAIFVYAMTTLALYLESGC